MKKKHVFLFIFLITFSFFGRTQDSTMLKNEIGFALNRFLPDVQNEFRPYFFSLEFRHNWKTSAKYKHFVSLRLCGNINNSILKDPDTDKLFAGGELGYRGYKLREKESKWAFSYGVNLGAYYTRERVNYENSETITVPEPFTINRTYTAFGLSPNIGIEYAFNKQTYVQLILTIGIRSKYIGDVAHLENNRWRGFSAQFPSIGIFRKF